MFNGRRPPALPPSLPRPVEPKLDYLDWLTDQIGAVVAIVNSILPEVGPAFVAVYGVRILDDQSIRNETEGFFRQGFLSFESRYAVAHTIPNLQPSLAEVRRVMDRMYLKCRSDYLYANPLIAENNSWIFIHPTAKTSRPLSSGEEFEVDNIIRRIGRMVEKSPDLETYIINRRELVRYVEHEGRRRALFTQRPLDLR